MENLLFWLLLTVDGALIINLIRKKTFRRNYCFNFRKIIDVEIILTRIVED